MAAIKARLESVFQKVFDDQSIRIHEGMTADDVEEWDSVMHISLLISIEQEFGIQFRTEEVMSVANVGDFITLLEKKVEAHDTK